MPIFDAGYGDAFGLTSSQMRGQNQVLTQWSGEVLRLGRDLLVFPRFLSLTPPGITMGQKKGDTFRIPIFNWIEDTAGTTALVSGTTIPLLTQGTLNVYGTLDEFGRGIGLENTLDYYTKLDNGREVTETLADNRSRVLNELCRQVIDATPHNMVVGTAGAVGTLRFNVSGSATNTAAGTISSSVVKGVYDHFKANRVPTFGNGLYVWVSNAARLRPLKDEGVFETFNTYQNAPGLSVNGIVYQVIGNWEGFTFVQTEEGMSAGTLKYSYAIAPQVGAQAYAKPISLYYYPDINSDANRLNVIKWHMIAGFAQTLRDYGTRAIKVFSA